MTTTKECSSEAKVTNFIQFSRIHKKYQNPSENQEKKGAVLSTNP